MDAPTLTLRLMGGFDLLGPGEAPIGPAPRKARALLGYLALARDRTAPREHLAALLWPGAEPDQARASLRQALAAVRRLAPALDADGEHARLSPAVVAADAWDLEQFAQGGSEESLERALLAWRGPLLSGLRVDSDEYDHWRTAESERLRGLAAEAGLRLLRGVRGRGELPRAAEVAARLLAVDPLREDVHRTLMELHVALGRPGDALRQYRRCRTLLAEQLGVPPEPATEALYREISAARRVPSVTPTPQPGLDPSSAPVFAAEVVVVISDIAGFTAYAADHEAEHVHAYLTEHRAAARDIAQARGGVLSNFIGARVMMLFGVPEAHGDDAARALSAALALRDYADAHRSADGQRLRLRAGVASGRGIATVEDGQFTVTGAAVSVAGRVVEQAPPGDVWATEAVVQAAAERVTAEALAPSSVPALGESLSVWRITAFGTVNRAQSVRFVGRTRELGLVQSTLSAVASARRGRLLLIRGEPGIGKSRLLAECLARAAQQGFAVHATRVLEIGAGRRADPVRALVASLLGIAESAPPEARRAALDEALEALVLTPSLRAPLCDVLDLPLPTRDAALWDAQDGPARDAAIQLALARLADAAARQRPLLVAVDDAQWAGAGATARIAAVARGMAGHAAVLVVAMRDDAPDADLWRRVSGREALVEIALGPMPSEEAQRLAWSYGMQHEDFLHACVARAAGHPLFLDQLLRLGPDRAGELPGSVRNVVLARLSGLDAPDLAALQAAAVLGVRFGLDDLRHVAGDPAFVPDALVDRGLLRREEDSLVFSHALVREAVAESVIAERRRSLHARAAQRFADDPPVAAAHFAAAGDPRAATAFLEAARAERDRRHLERALELARQGLAVPGHEDARAQLREIEAALLLDLGALESAAERFHAAIALADEPMHRCRVLIGLASALHGLDRQHEALEALEGAHALALRLEDRHSRALVALTRGRAWFPLGETGRCLEAYSSALQLAREAGVPGLESRALGGLGDAHYQRGRFWSAHDYFARCVALARERRQPQVEVANLPMLALSHAYRARIPEALEGIAQALELARALRDVRSETLAEDVRAEVLNIAGRWDAAAAAAARTVELARRIGARRFAADGLLQLAYAARGSDGPGAGTDLAEEALALAREAALAYCGATAWATVAWCTTDPARRDAALSEALRLLDAGSVSHNHLHVHPLAALLALEDGDTGRARSHAHQLEVFLGDEPAEWPAFMVSQIRGLADAADGMPEAGGTLAALAAKAADLGLDDDAARLGRAFA